MAAVTCAVCGLALAVEFYSPLPFGFAALYQTALPFDNSGDTPVPPKEFFQRHCWFFIVLPLYRLLHATLRSLRAPLVLPALGVLLHFGVYAADLPWPLMRHPYDTSAPWDLVSSAFYGSHALRDWTRTHLPSCARPTAHTRSALT